MHIDRLFVQVINNKKHGKLSEKEYHGMLPWLTCCFLYILAMLKICIVIPQVLNYYIRNCRDKNDSVFLFPLKIFQMIC